MLFRFADVVQGVLLDTQAPTVLPAVGEFLEGLEDPRLVEVVEAALAKITLMHTRLSPRRKEVLAAALVPANGRAAPVALGVGADILVQLATTKNLDVAGAAALVAALCPTCDVAVARAVLLPNPIVQMNLSIVHSRIATDDAAAPALAPPPPAKAHRTEAAPTAHPAAPAATPVAHPPSAAAVTHGTVTLPTFPPNRFDSVPPPRGTDPAPPSPLDPEHPQRVMGGTTDKVVARMQKQSAAHGFVADVKYDGERLLARRLPDGTFVFHSRNMLPVPDRKLDRVREMLAEAFPTTATFSIDAEILSLHTHGSLNELTKADIAANGPRIYIFDCVWLNDFFLAPKPLVERRERLLKALRPTKRVTMCETMEFSGRGDWAAHVVTLRNALKSLLSRGLEGFVVKPLASAYRFGGTDWVKVKAGYLTDVDGGKLPPGLRITPPGSPAGPSPLGSPVTRGVAAARGHAYAAAHAAHAALDGAGTAPAPAAPAVAAAAPAPPRTLLSVRLTDTLDCLVIGLAPGGRKALIACLNGATGRYTTVGFATIPREIAVPSHCMRPFSRTRRLDFCDVSGDLEGAVERAVEQLRDCIIVEVAASRLNQSLHHTCDGLEVSSDAAIMRLREDKSPRDVTQQRYVVALFHEERKRGVSVRTVGATAKPSAAPPAAVTPTAVVAPSAPARITTVDEVPTDIFAMNASVADALLAASARALTAVPRSHSAGVTTAPLSHEASVAALVASHASRGAVLVVLVAQGKPWSARGAMRDCEAVFGTAPRILSDVTFSRAPSETTVVGTACRVVMDPAVVRAVLVAGVLEARGAAGVVLSAERVRQMMSLLSFVADFAVVGVEYFCEAPNRFDAAVLHGTAVVMGVPKMTIFVRTSSDQVE